jgi:hypothetical protein
VHYLERMLEDEREARTEERRRRDTLMAQLMQRIPQLEAPSEAPEASETADEQQGRGEPHSATVEDQQGTPRPWWRRVFGGCPSPLFTQRRGETVWKIGMSPCRLIAFWRSQRIEKITACPRYG